jgi:hypothetical protein
MVIVVLVVLVLLVVPVLLVGLVLIVPVMVLVLVLVLVGGLEIHISKYISIDTGVRACVHPRIQIRVCVYAHVRDIQRYLIGSRVVPRWFFVIPGWFQCGSSVVPDRLLVVPGSRVVLGGSR